MIQFILQRATGAASGQSFILEDLEPTFGEDLSGDGRLSAVLVTSPGSGNVLNLPAQTHATIINFGTPLDEMTKFANWRQSMQEMQLQNARVGDYSS